MWENAETVVLLDREGRVRAVSRNEEEASIRDIIGMRVIDRVHPDSLASAQAAMKAAFEGEGRELLAAAYADDGSIFWSRVQCLPSPMEDWPILVHTRKLPAGWGKLSPREQELVQALHDAEMNPKKAAKQLGITLNTLNAHRRSICQKCKLKGVGDFWVFVEHCR